MAVPITLVYKLKAWDAGVEPSVTTWGDVKTYAASETGVPEADIRLLFRGRERPDDEPLAVAGVQGGEKVSIAERMRPDRASDPSLAASPRLRPLTSLGEDEDDAEEEEDEASPSPAPPPPRAPTTPADWLAAVASSLDTLDADAAPLLAASTSRSRAPTWPPDALKTAVRVSEFATQALLSLDAIAAPDDASDEDRQTLRMARKAFINRAVALGEAMDRVKGQLK